VVVTLVAVPFRDRLEPGTAALIMLVAPLVAAFGTLRLAVVASAVSALVFNVVFTHPYYSLGIESTTSIVAFVTYTVVALVLGLVIVRMRRAVESSERHAREARHGIALVQSASHDLRTPLASVRALASSIPHAGPVNAEQQQVVADIEAQCVRLGDTVEQVLDLTRIEGGLLQPRLQTVSLDDLLASAIEAVGPSVDVSLRVDDDVPAIPVDEPLIRQVVVNLLENAKRFGEPPIQIRVVSVGDGVQIRVRDRGPGVSQQELRALLDPEAPARRDSAGRARGLGLLVSEGFVRAHGGTLRAESPSDGGAMFIVTLPREAPRELAGSRS
jgi:K+-sensing histidine kinase KdpD